MNTTFAEKTIAILREYCDREHGGNVRAASRALDVDPDTGLFSRWLKCFDENAKSKQFPRIDSLGPCLDKVGAKVLAPWETESGFDDAHPTPAQSPSPCSSEVARLRARIMELEREIGATRTERDKAIGQVELLKEQLATESAKKDVASAERVSSPATRGSTRAG